MYAKFVARFSLFAALLWVSGPAFAHHGAAGYDSNKLTTLKGTVTDYRFQNPHAQIFIDVKDSSGKVQNWVLEAVGIATLSRSGWTKSIMKGGDGSAVT